MSTRKWRRFISIADGRTSTCGSSDESILRRSRGKSPYYSRALAIIVPEYKLGFYVVVLTFAINSVFLNSPSISVTRPFSSSSVHFSISSFDGFGIRSKEELSIRKLAIGGRSSGCSGFCFRLSFERQSHRLINRLCTEKRSDVDGRKNTLENAWVSAVWNGAESNGNETEEDDVAYLLVARRVNGALSLYVDVGATF
jgi:hypothetical protein